MHVTLVDPVWNYDVHCMSESLGLLYLASSLRAAGHEVSVLHTATDELDAALLQDSDLIGFTSTSALFENTTTLLRRVRRLAPTTPVVIGGPHATVATEDALRAGFHAAFLGEAERSLVQFAANLARNEPYATPGIAYLDGDRVVRTPAPPLVQELDELPHPARDLFDYGSYLERGGWEFGMVASRGCPYQCTFCQPTIDQLFGRYRKRSARDVALELAEVHDAYQPPIVYFKDDTMAANGASWFRALADDLAALGVRPAWKCNNRVDTCDPELAAAMARAGCSEMIFGVESGSQRILDFYQKGTRVEQAEQAFAVCRELGLRTGANIVLGAPVETREELDLTVELVQRLQPDNYWVFFLTALPGKHITAYATAHDLLITSAGYHYYDTAINGVRAETNLRLENLTLEDLRGARDRIFRSLGGRQRDLAEVYARCGYLPAPADIEELLGG